MLRKTAVILILSAVALAAPKTGAKLWAQSAKKAPATMALKVGDMAPDFTLLTLRDNKLQQVSLKDFRGKKVALAFYIFAFTGG